MSPWLWLTAVWAYVIGSLDGPVGLSRPGSGGSGGLSGFPPLVSSMEDISKRKIARKPLRIKYNTEIQPHWSHASPTMSTVELQIASKQHL